MQDEFEYTRSTDSVESTKFLGSSLQPYLQAGDTVVLSGDLGAGKTQFVQGVAHAFGVVAAVTSPSFNIVLSYVSKTGMLLYHLDFYRLASSDELEDIAFYEILDSGGVSFIEWGEKFREALPESYLEIFLSIDKYGSRQIRVRAVGANAHRTLSFWAQDPQSHFMKCEA